MDLVSVSFLLFLSIVCVVAYLCPRRIRYVALLAASYAFYLYDPVEPWRKLPALGLLLCATLVSWACGLIIGKAQKLWLRRTALILSVATCLGMLLLFKYYDFFATGLRIVSGVHLPVLDLILPLGISYYTLQTISYTADVYLKTAECEKDPLLYALYVSFFPGIVTGPINRAPAMLAQYKAPPKFEYARVSGGLFRILWGFFKKMVIADRLAIYTASVFTAVENHTGPELVLAALLFSYQLYADFGGSCDIAIGAARMLGFTFMENFERPFAAKTFSGLWQRWHISLTGFFRDYVFTPLVWSRWPEKLPFLKKWVKKPPAASSVLIIFTLSGLWHGPYIGYVIWGLLNGIVMSLAKIISKPKERLVKKIPLYRAKPVRGFFQRIFVYLLFTGCLVFFAAALYRTSTLAWLAGAFSGWGQFFSGNITAALAKNGLPLLTCALLAIGILLVELIEKFAVRPGSTVADWVRRRGWFWRWPLYYLLIAAILLFGVFSKSVFIYQQF